MMKDSMRRLSAFAAVFAVLGGLLAAGTGSASAESLRHLSLLRSNPAANAVLESAPAEVRLVFSEAPRPQGSSVRLTLGEALVATSAAAPDSADAKQLVIRPDQPLASGSYTVHWRVLARDGHAINGTFGFRIAAD